LTFKTRGYCYWWEIIPSGNVSFAKGLWLDGSLGVEPTSVGIALADGLCDLRLKSLQLKASIIVEDGLCPFELYPGICLATEEKHGKHQ
jgi:hypothetical protein